MNDPLGAEPYRLDGGNRGAGRGQRPDRELGVGPLVNHRHGPSLARHEARRDQHLLDHTGPRGVALADGGLTVAGW